MAEANRARGHTCQQFTRRIVKKSMSDNDIWGCFAVELLLRHLGKAWSATRFYKEMSSNSLRCAGVGVPPVPEATYRKYQQALEAECTKDTVKEYIAKLKDATNPLFKQFWTKCASSADLTFKLSIDDDFMHLKSYVGVIRVIKGKGIGCMNTTATCPVTGIVTGWSSLVEGRGASECRGELVGLLGDGGFDWMQFVDRGYIGDRVSMVRNKEPFMRGVQAREAVCQKTTDPAKHLTVTKSGKILIFQDGNTALYTVTLKLKGAVPLRKSSTHTRVLKPSA